MLLKSECQLLDTFGFKVIPHSFQSTRWKNIDEDHVRLGGRCRGGLAWRGTATPTPNRFRRGYLCCRHARVRNQGYGRQAPPLVPQISEILPVIAVFPPDGVVEVRVDLEFRDVGDVG